MPCSFGDTMRRNARSWRARENAHYLPGIHFPDSLHIEANLARLAGTTQQFLLAVPSHAFRATLKALKPHLDSGATLAWATKGLEPGSGKLLSAVLAEELPTLRA